MAIQDDYTINYVTKTITHTSGSTVYTVNALYSWLMDTFDELSQLDDSIPMSAQTPTEYTLINGWLIPDESFQFLKGGAVKTSDNNYLWANIYTLGSIQPETAIYIVQSLVKVAAWWVPGHIDVLVKVKTAGALIDSGIVTVFARELSDTYSHFQIDLSAGGRNAVPLATDDDLNNQTAAATIAAWSDITLTFGTTSKTLGGVTKNYDLIVSCASRTLAQVYEYLKYITRNASAVTLNTVEGWRYKNANPGTYADEVKSPFGTFAGGKFFGARGVWIESYDSNDAKNFQLIAADGTVVSPPNVVPVKVTGVVSGDRVLVAKLTGAGGTINKAQYNLTAGNNSGNGAVVVQESITNDTPSSGFLRIGDDRYQYDSWAGSTFTLHAGVTLSKSYALGDDAYVPFVDEQASTTISQTTITYAADVPVLIRVRKKGILPFEVESSIVNTGLSVAAIRTIDSIVS